MAQMHGHGELVCDQVGGMVAHILDSLESRMGALAAVWISLGVTNLTCLANLLLAALHEQQSVMLSILLALTTGITLFLTGIASCAC